MPFAGSTLQSLPCRWPRAHGVNGRRQINCLPQDHRLPGQAIPGPLVGQGNLLAFKSVRQLVTVLLSLASRQVHGPRRANPPLRLAMTANWPSPTDYWPRMACPGIRGPAGNN